MPLESKPNGHAASVPTVAEARAQEEALAAVEIEVTAVISTETVEALQEESIAEPAAPEIIPDEHAGGESAEPVHEPPFEAPVESDEPPKTPEENS